MNRQEVKSAKADWLEWSHRMQEERRRNPPPVVVKLMKLKTETEAMKKTNDSQISS
ncbi:hypothetical protein HW132_24470 [Brasilonema sp. CT11]|nr:hypothetical protein [Brasilonema sp. CT11]